MSGFGERFRRAGYAVPKPLIEIDEKPIIAHVIDMFPGERDFIFICNSEHLANPDYRMEEILQQYCPTGRIVGIPPHKLGPIHAVRQVKSMIDPTRPVVVNYCDFTCYWDWQNFKRFVQSTKCAGAIPAYKGFHPHTLGTTNYAYMRTSQGWVLDIQEKQPYTDNRMEEYASSGTYYFSSGHLMLDAFQATMECDLNVGGEYYVSLAYKPLFKAGQPVAVYPLQHFMQWGTPEDVAEYEGWSTVFRKLLESEQARSDAGTVVVPMAGLGQRFADQGYAVTKPLIPVSGQPMVLQATHDLPAAQRYGFVLRADMPGHESIARTLTHAYPGAHIETIETVTEGQGCTALIGMEATARATGSLPGPITFGACDNGVLYNQARLRALIDDPAVDVIVWGVRGHANAARQPQMFGWIDASDRIIKQISVKTALGSPATDPIVVGTFTFKRPSDFRHAMDRLIARNGRINGEFYIDACINDAIAIGLKCHLFEVESFISWGTPNDLRIFEYWQSCFHKWAGHPYRMEQDHRIPVAAVTYLSEKYRQTVPELPSAHQ
ncbi:sugar phosphate nucleotidyltransferase [Cupriavidus sp. BIC8F]|uniref:sugar phosphate nucleotidyltransferase n=1 Tax=Cupriavidus sp. BIC8F TaxID=3079014 RepID=UPI0029170DEB|nr:sugar phosphate nucleotidyltransferase [Cupriavidus sp. BIC8F]